MSRFIKIIKKRYKNAIHNNTKKADREDASKEYSIGIEQFVIECYKVCNNEDAMCDIVLDICYQKESSKQFAWDVCGNVIIKNLLKRKGGMIHYPQAVDDGDFSVNGKTYLLGTCKYNAEDDE